MIHGILKRCLVAVVLLTAAGCTRTPQQKEAKFLQRGESLLAKGDSARAVLEFRNAAQAMPKDAEPYYRAGLAYLALGDGTNAIKAFLQAVTLNPKHAGAQLKLAEIMTASRKKDLVEDAARRLQGLIAASPDDAEAIDTLAMADFELGKTEDAAKLLEDALQKFPSRLESSVALARLKLSRHDLNGAELVLKQAGASAPQSSPAALALAQLYMLLGRREKAEAGMRTALQLDPKNAGALLGLATIQVDAKRMDEAERTYRQLAALPEKKYKPLHAIFLYRAGKRDAALAEFEKLAKDDPGDRAARDRLVALSLEMNKTAEAQRVLAAALKRNPKDTDALLQRSVLYMKAGKAAEARTDLMTVLHFEPNSAEAHFALAGVYKAENLPKIENQELQEALRLNPELLPARLALAKNLLGAKDAKSALDVTNGAPGAQRNALPLAIERNWALLALGQIKELRTELDGALKSDRVPELVLQDTILRIEERDYAGARADAEELLHRNPEDIQAAQATAESFAAQGQVSRAVERIAELAAARPKSAALQFLLGQWERKAGKLVEARKAFEDAKSADGGLSSADLALADMDQRDGHLETAHARLTAIVTADAKNVPALLMLGGLDGYTGDRAAAIARFRAVLAIEPANMVALNDLAYYLAPDDPDAALRLAEQANEIAPANATIEDTLGFVYYRKSDYKTAVGYLQTAVAKEPTPQRQFHLGMAYLKAGDRDLGVKTLEAALKKDPNLAKSEHGW